LSDGAQIIVDIEVSAEQAPEAANMVRAWLVAERITVAEQATRFSGGHHPGENYRAAVATGEDMLCGSEPTEL
jgi:hypothetical protein